MQEDLPPRVAFTADRIFSACGEVVKDGFVVVCGQEIERISATLPSDVDVIYPFPGCTLMPGLINAHSHVSIVPSLGDQLGQLRLPFETQMAAARSNVLFELLAGVTTMRVMGQERGVDFALRQEIESGRSLGPDLICAGKPIAKKGCHGHALTAVSSSAELEHLCLENLERGARLLKVFATGGISSAQAGEADCPFSEGELRKVVEIAHGRGCSTAAHALGGEGARRAIAAGIDTIEHAAMLSEDLIDQVVKKKLAVVGTFSILFHPAGIEAEAQTQSAIREKLVYARPLVEETWRRIVASGARIALGTDSMHGCMSVEIAQLVRFGVSVETALLAATRQGAEICGLTDRGSIASGKRADLLAVPGNPLQDPASIAAPVLVVKAGRIVHRIPVGVPGS